MKIQIYDKPFESEWTWLILRNELLLEIETLETFCFFFNLAFLDLRTCESLNKIASESVVSWDWRVSSTIAHDSAGVLADIPRFSIPSVISQENGEGLS